jgi:hypothetical protein
MHTHVHTIGGATVAAVEEMRFSHTHTHTHNRSSNIRSNGSSSRRDEILRAAEAFVLEPAVVWACVCVYLCVCVCVCVAVV